MNKHPHTGRLWGVGVGPGDPDLMTVKAVRIVQQADIIAYPVAKRRNSNARSIVASLLRSDQIELPMVYPVTTEATDHLHGYDSVLRKFYDETALAIAGHLDAGQDVAILCEGDPLFYGSYMYLHDRLADRYLTEVIPGIPSPMAAAARLQTPLARRDAETAILPGTLSEDVLAAQIRKADACVIMKVGRNFEKIRRALDRAGAIDRAFYIERVSMPGERIIPIRDVDPVSVPYFSLILVPSCAAKVQAAGFERGELTVVGLGPGDPAWLTPEASRALQDATDLVGYRTYLNRVPPRAGQRRHESDNKVELDRACHALTLAAAGCRACVVSSGDPGIFAMASAVMEALENGPSEWREIPIRVLPGVSAMQAAAARVGAPLGHDFCVISLSDRLKPWDVIVERLQAAAAADFALALYNPASSERQWQLLETRNILLRHRATDTPVVVARDVGGDAERIVVTSLGQLDSAAVDMRTILLVGSSKTTLLCAPDGRTWVYTPRSYSRTEPSSSNVHDVHHVEI
jgi:precorrin-2 C20-methyltransferase/precorrin-3B C17-methyltransferase